VPFASSSLSDFARTAAENADLAGIPPEFASGMSTYHPEFGENPNSNLDSLARTLKVRQAASPVLFPGKNFSERLLRVGLS
jgi:hypothetical protein